MPAPDKYVAWMTKNARFNPRAQEHSNFLTDEIFADLAVTCPRIGEGLGNFSLEVRKNKGMAGQGYALNKALKALDALKASSTLSGDERMDIDTNIDGILLKRDGLPVTPIALENKTISTAHSKARTNRWKDAREFAGHVHEVDRNSIAAFTILINMAADYANPDDFVIAAKATGSNKTSAAEDTIRLFTDGMPIRSTPVQPDIWNEAVYVLVVNYDGTNPAQLVTTSPAPSPGAPYSYDWFLDRLCELYCARN